VKNVYKNEEKNGKQKRIKIVANCTGLLAIDGFDLGPVVTVVYVQTDFLGC